MVSAAIATVFARESAKDAHAQWRVVSDQLRDKIPRPRDKSPRLGDMMDSAEHEVLSYMDLPRAHWLQIHSTNPLERLNAEIKLRTNVAGIFPNDRAITLAARGLAAWSSSQPGLARECKCQCRLMFPWGGVGRAVRTRPSASSVTWWA